VKNEWLRPAETANIEGFRKHARALMNLTLARHTLKAWRLGMARGKAANRSQQVGVRGGTTRENEVKEYPAT
jgi:hypothetical protein